MAHSFFQPPATGDYALRHVTAPRCLVQGGPPGDSDLVALDIAIDEGHAATIDALLAAGAPLDARNLVRAAKSGRTPSRYCDTATKFQAAVPVSQEFLASPARTASFPAIICAYTYGSSLCTSEMASRSG